MSALLERERERDHCENRKEEGRDEGEKNRDIDILRGVEDDDLFVRIMGSA